MTPSGHACALYTMLNLASRMCHMFALVWAECCAVELHGVTMGVQVLCWEEPKLMNSMLLLFSFNL
jgi:hypothetical protein